MRQFSITKAPEEGLAKGLKCDLKISSLMLLVGVLAKTFF
jgi:hypothetical protein